MPTANPSWNIIPIILAFFSYLNVCSQFSVNYAKKSIQIQGPNETNMMYSAWDRIIKSEVCAHRSLIYVTKKNSLHQKKYSKPALAPNLKTTLGAFYKES